MRLTFAMACAAALLAAGCDATAPEFEVTNPYDPLFEGTRIATAPTDLELVSSSGGTLTIRWTDRSSFETGFQLERGASLLSSQFGILARLPSNTVEFTDPDVANAQEYRYRITAVVAGETNSVPSDILRLRRQQRTQTLQGIGPGASRVAFSPDGSRAYAFTGISAVAVNTLTGFVDGTLSGAISPVGVLPDGRVVAVRATAPTAVSVGIYAVAALERTVTLAPSGAACPQIVAESVVVSDDAQTFAGLCSAPGTDSRGVAVWGASGGSPLRVINAAGVRALVLALSPDGQRVAVSAASATGGRELSAFDAATGAALWSERDTRSADTPLRFSPDSQRLFDATTGRLQLRSAATGAVLAAQSDPPDRPTDIVFSTDGTSVAVVTTSTATVTVFRTSDLSQTYRVRDTRTTGIRLLAGNVILGVRGTTQGGVVYDAARWDPQAPWEVVPATSP